MLKKVRAKLRMAFVLICLLSLGQTAFAQAGITSLGSSSTETGTTSETTTSPDEAVSRLLEVLKDDAARAELIQQLEALAPEAEVATEETPSEEIVSFGRRVATITQELVQSTAQNVSGLFASFSNSQSAFSGLRGDEFRLLWSALPSLLVVILITISVFLTLRTFAKPRFQRIGEKAKIAGIWERTMLFVGSIAVDVLIVMVAWAIGYAVTVFLVNDFGVINIRQSMYLNAFFIVEMVKVGIRMILSPNAHGLRLVPLTNWAAHSLTKSLSIVVSILGYGQLLIVPIVNQSSSFAAGNGVSAVLAALVLVYLIYVVIRRRRRVAMWLTSWVDAKPSDYENQEGTDAEPTVAGEDTPPEKQTKAQGAFAAFAQRWHWFALAYLSGMFLIAMTQPVERVTSFVFGSGQIVAVLIVASMTARWLAGMVTKGISLPADINQKIPLLEPRINSFANRAFATLRWIILAVAMLIILDIIGLVDLRSWAENRIGLALTSNLITLFGIVFVSFAIWLAVTSWIDYRLNPDFGEVPTSRETTLLTLFRNAATITLLVLALMFCLSELGLNIGPLLASAGVLGLAIGFGAQKMVQDIITGIFIQFENAINVGDIITVGGITGGVEKLSVRSVSLRDAFGVFHIIPFSSVDMVSNFSRDYSYYVCDMGVAYRENIDEVKAAMMDAFDLLLKHPEQGTYVRDQLEWFGIEAFADSAVVVRARVKTVPGRQFMVGRAYNDILKRVFDERGIEIPFPHRTIYLGEAKDGSTQAFKVQKDED